MAIIDKLSAIGDAIREKTGSTDLLTLDQMPGIIEGIQTGGGEDRLSAYMNGELIELIDDEILLIKQYAFNGDGNISNVILPNCKKINYYGFGNCVNLINFEAENLEEINTNAFKKCVKLASSLYFPKLTLLGDEAFYECADLKYIACENLEEIKTSAFRDSGLENAYFPKVSKIGGYAFDGTNFVAITDEMFPRFTTLSGFYQFCDNYYLERVKLSNIVEIREGMFVNCNRLQEIEFPKVILVEKSGFSKANFTTLSPSNLPIVEEIQSEAFSYNNSLVKADFSNTLKRIKSTSSSAKGTFYQNTLLETIIFRTEDAPITLTDTKAFDGTPIANGTGYIYVPSALIEDYKVATNWTVYADQFRAIEDYPEICGEVV